MTRGTYAEAIEAGFNKTQAAFFSKLSIDLKNEVAERMHKEAETIRIKSTLKHRIADKLKKIAEWLVK